VQRRLPELGLSAVPALLERVNTDAELAELSIRADEPMWFTEVHGEVCTPVIAGAALTVAAFAAGYTIAEAGG